jgi:glyoxylase-like metal-dependent hydrolase (beta-lactamase superfamily II)
MIAALLIGALYLVSLSRRNFCLCCMTASSAAAGGWLTPSQAYAQARAIVWYIKAEAVNANITVHSLRRNVSMLQGSGGNIAVLTGNDGKLLVDAGIAASRQPLTDAMDSISTDPIRHLINTHWHFDHTDGNAWLHNAGAAIIAHDNTRKRLLSTQRVEDWKTDFPAPPLAALPTNIFTTKRIMNLNNSTLALTYVGPAHTDGDIAVFFSEANILHTGDVFWNGIYPFIDYSTGGSIDGAINGANKVLAMVDENTFIIPGHGPIGYIKELTAFRDMLLEIRDNVYRLKKQGHSIEQVLVAKPTAKYDPVWGNFVIDPDFFTRLVYEGV